MPPVGFEPTISAGERPQAAHQQTPSFRGAALTFDLNPLEFYLWGHLKTLLCSATVKNRHFY